MGTWEIIKIAKNILRRFILHILLTIAVLLLVGYFQIMSYSRVYSSTSIIRVVRTSTQGELGLQKYVADVNILTRQNKSISKIAVQSSTLDLVRNELGNLSDSYLKSRIKVFPYPDMDLIEVTGIDSDQVNAQKISAALANAIVTRAKQLEQEAPTGTNLQIIQEGRVPTTPSSVPKKTMFTLWTVFTLFISCLLWAYIFFIDRRIESEEDITSSYDIPLIVSIPTIKNKTKDVKVLLDRYQTVTSFLRFTKLVGIGQTIAIVSGKQGEGKSVTTANIGKSFSYMGQKVLLVDLDTRRPSLQRIFSQPSKENSYARAIINGSDLPTPDVVENNISLYAPSMIQDWECGKVFTSPKISSLIKDNLKTPDNWVIFDTPPILSLPSITAALKQIENAIVVVMLRKTKNVDLNKTINILKREGVNTIGIIAVGSKNRGFNGYYSTSKI